MKLSKLKPGDNFLTDSGVKFQVLLMNKSEIRLHKNKIKVRRIDTGEPYFIENLIIRKI